MFERLSKVQIGRLLLRDAHGESAFGDERAELLGVVDIRNERFYRRLVMNGGLGAAESYLDGDWESPDLLNAIHVLAANLEVLQRVEGGWPRLLRPLRAAAGWLRRNTPAGSRRNIAAHYDLSNRFFEVMLDPSMTYSSGYFPHADATLEEASREKYDRICRRLRLSTGDRVLEIGTGWGGFALHAASEYGCHITTTTISLAQHDYAKDRIQRAGLDDQVELLLSDYRALSGRYDKLVSIEMIEAVGERFLPVYFRQCSRLLEPDGAMLLQAITIPDCRYDAYRRDIDFIQKHIFPGGFLPSPGAIAKCLGGEADFRLAHMEDFSEHYARTLAGWRSNFVGRIEEVRALGFDDRFVRTWLYYLCYCEAGFRERQVGVSQWLLTKPRWRSPAG